jgi:hypothetical protein
MFNFTSSLRRLGVCFSVVLVVVAAAALTALPADGAPHRQLGLQLPDACAASNADSIFYVPSQFTSTDSQSGSGEYFYKPGGTILAPVCHYWIADVKLASYSNTNGQAQGLPVKISGEAYDLPSSTASPWTVPGNAVDCNRFTLWERFYRKLSSETSFTLLGTGTFTGLWTINGCVLTPAAGSISSVDAVQPASGWNTYRIAVAVKLRSSGQEVHALFVGKQPSPPIPK